MSQLEQGDKMTKHHGNGAASEVSSLPPRPPSSASTASTSSSASSSKHVKCIGRYLLTGTTLGKGNFARVEAAVHTLTQAKVRHLGTYPVVMYYYILVWCIVYTQLVRLYLIRLLCGVSVSLV